MCWEILCVTLGACDSRSTATEQRHAAASSSYQFTRTDCAYLSPTWCWVKSEWWLENVHNEKIKNKKKENDHNGRIYTMEIDKLEIDKTGIFFFFFRKLVLKHLPVYYLPPWPQVLNIQNTLVSTLAMLPITIIMSSIPLMVNCIHPTFTFLLS